MGFQRFGKDSCLRKDLELDFNGLGRIPDSEMIWDWISRIYDGFRIGISKIWKGFSIWKGFGMGFNGFAKDSRL